MAKVVVFQGDSAIDDFIEAKDSECYLNTVLVCKTRDNHHISYEGKYELDCPDSCFDDGINDALSIFSEDIHQDFIYRIKDEIEDSRRLRSEFDIPGKGYSCCGEFTNRGWWYKYEISYYTEYKPTVNEPSACGQWITIDMYKKDCGLNCYDALV